MPHPVTPRITEPDGRLPSGQLWLPAAGLSACVRATVVRNTVGHELTDAQRFNHFPAAPLCSLSWWFQGCSHNVLLTDDNRHAPLSAPRQPMPGCVFHAMADTIPRHGGHDSTLMADSVPA